MTSIPTSTYARFTNTVWYNQNLNRELNSLLEQQTTGKKPGGLSGLGVDASRSLDAKRVSERSESYMRSLNTLERRTSIYASSLNSLQSVAAEAREKLFRLDGQQYATDDLMVGVIDDLLNEVQAALSARDGDRYLFSGSAIDERPTVDLAAIAMPPGILDPDDPLADPGMLPDSGWINLDADAIWDRHAVQVDDDETMTYGISALEPAIQHLVNGLLTAKHAYSNPSPPDSKEDLLDRALEWTGEAITGIATLEAQNGYKQSRIESLAESHAGTVDFLERVTSDIEDVDLAKVATKMSMVRTVLEASYSSTNTLLRLNLLNYTR